MLEDLQFHMVRNRSTLGQLAPGGWGGSLGIGEAAGGGAGKYLARGMSVNLAGVKVGGGRGEGDIS